MRLEKTGETTMTIETNQAATQVEQTEQNTEQGTNTAREVIARRRRRQSTYDPSKPSFTRQITLNSLQSQRVYNRSFVRVSRSLFSIDVILQIITDRNGDRQAIDAMETAIRELFTKFSTDLADEIGRCKKLLADNGISEGDMATYTDPREIQVQLTSPQVIEFARLMVQLDELMSLVDTLWLNTIFDNRQRADANFVWQQRLIKLASRIIGNEGRARRAAYRAGHQEEVDEFAPAVTIEDDEELASEVAKIDAEETAAEETVV